jgi:hypothetical protein
VGWTMAGACYKQGRRVPGFVRLNLEGGGWKWFPEETPLLDALAIADALGYSTAGVRARLQSWVETGTGASFELK